MREIEAFGLCHDFVNLWKHGQREAAVKKAAVAPRLAGSRGRDADGAPEGCRSL
jgi:hypothetical protein